MCKCITEDCNNIADNEDGICDECYEIGLSIECCFPTCQNDASAMHNGENYCQEHYLEQINHEASFSNKIKKDEDEYESDDLDTSPTSDECEHCNNGIASVNFNGTNLCEDCADDYMPNYD